MRLRPAILLLALAACTKKTEPAPAAAAPAPQAAAAATGAILLGHVASMTGTEATFGANTDKGLRLAIEEQNANGGVKGRKVELLTLDDAGKPEEAAVAATRLALQEKVLVMFGENASSRSLAMAPIADRERIPMISSTSTNPRVTKDGDATRPYVFRVCFIDPFQGYVMAKFAREDLKLDRVAILRDVGNDYSKGLADYFKTTFEKLGGTIVSDQAYKSGDQDFKAQLTAMKGKDPQGLWIPGYYTDAALIARQARELGMKQPILGGDGFDSPKLAEIGQAAVEGAYFSNHYSPDDPSPRIQEFGRKYREKHGETPDSLAAAGYDSAKIAFAAMERAAELTGPAVRDALEATKDFPAVTGVITLDADHNAVKPAVVLQVKDGRFVYVTTVKP
jgi:branched-chain amino acid transport system substrate-binding protein